MKSDIRISPVCGSSFVVVGYDNIVAAKELVVEGMIDHIHMFVVCERSLSPIDLARE